MPFILAPLAEGGWRSLLPYKVPTAFEIWFPIACMSIPWTLLSNFYFLHHPHILTCLKAIAKYRNMHAPLYTLCSHACTYHSRSGKIIGSIHSTLLSNFHFLHRQQILHCLKAIAKYRNIYAYIVLACMHISLKKCKNFFEFTLNPPGQLSFSSWPPNSALFKSYSQIFKCPCMFMHIALACMHM